MKKAFLIVLSLLAFSLVSCSDGCDDAKDEYCEALNAGDTAALEAASEKVGTECSPEEAIEFTTNAQLGDLCE